MAKDPLIFMSPSDPRAKLISPAYLKTTEIEAQTGDIRGTAAQSSGSIYFPPTVGTFVNLPGELQKLLPGLGDIEIVSEVVDSTTNPPLVNLTFRIRNSTGYPIKGLMGRKGQAV